jgi:hypothetical protein
MKEDDIWIGRQWIHGGGRQGMCINVAGQRCCGVNGRVCRSVRSWFEGGGGGGEEVEL